MFSAFARITLLTVALLVAEPAGAAPMRGPVGFANEDVEQVVNDGVREEDADESGNYAGIGDA